MGPFTGRAVREMRIPVISGELTATETAIDAVLARFAVNVRSNWAN